MRKNILALVLLLLAASVLAGCGNQTTNPAADSADYKIGVVTPTLSTSEDEFRAADMMAQKYPGIVKHITLPENFSTEIETGISQITSLADDPKMKAIIVISGQAGLLPALQKVEEKRPDIITMTAPIWDDPVLMSKYVDVNLDTDWVKRGETIARKAHSMGAKTLIHYSFPTHLAKEAIAQRKDMMQKTCAELDVQWVEVITPDPQTGNGTGPMLQFLREDIPRQISKYGTDTNIFGTNCPMYDVIIDEALKEKFLVAEQCCPTPTQAYPTVMGLEISGEDAWNFEKINDMIREKAAAAGMTNRLGGWPIPATVFIPEYAVELAKKKIEDPSFDYNDLQQLNQFGRDISGHGVTFSKFKPSATGTELANYNVMIMDSILY
ncbi:DUF3798 domain-containing protein [Pelotomaculum terephthalicicum JT]|uniref:DUF3798 domain-containing protein n=1 Tax=Pelotomaculum terephthalicicum TaxID=206393 RepID=UPI001F04936F|nr:DUF3798 domain-containing protein [Pelotomaculum terephthalicicum]MCG9967393.1 DUF3798 domain-containing protein [Pelotomaculum terephthalicicum JT]